MPKLESDQPAVNGEKEREKEKEKKGHKSGKLSGTSTPSASRSPSSVSLSLLPRLKIPRIEAPLPHIEFAPFVVPRQRRLQTAAVAMWSLMVPLTQSLFFILCSIPPFWPLIAAYLIWVFFIDDAPNNGARAWPWFRSLTFWKLFAHYYPAELMNEAALPPDRPYIFGYHPHGIIGMGAIASFATESIGFSESFPGIIPHLLTLSSNFYLPIYRDILLWMGIASVSRKSCANILKKGPGQSITIVIGGAAESLSAHPGTADLTLKKRFGFIKLAIQYGADLVPVFSFGENDIYEQLSNEKGTTLYKLQKKFQHLFGFTLPLFHGRGILNYTIGLMPYRRRIVIVCGRPIHVERVANPSQQLLEETQKLYIEELMRIWDTYKDAFAKQRRKELTLIA
ncbi:diacylglycerol acyltransferase [Dacryopinax primogenitus]|uniref:Diacylglycerol O-acyltransferase n=1 Tax=Dacryopinax primogenitus (strain DJM 731) TaxID=1858805 RepID=M5FTN9_DACPD|nr:diacylglycerol acyltransferase [Dacryopinax primogenitus]EJT96601.1 diacylglycerol acyltransferase [Dacryopinax primogenitus]